MDQAQRRVLGWLGVAVGACAAAVTGVWIWLTRFERLPGDFRLIAGGMGLLALVMALRCAGAALAPRHE